jgi:dolichol-phosphate mannosyltransferase
VRGLFTFYAICALGTVANVGIAGYVFARHEVWWLAGLAGVAVGSVWNYAVSSVFTWKEKITPKQINEDAPIRLGSDRRCVPN